MTIATAIPHLARVLDALEAIKDEQSDLGFITQHNSWAAAADASTDLKDALYALGVPGDVIHDHPEQLPRS